jgi:hypothetical protein
VIRYLSIEEITMDVKNLLGDVKNLLGDVKNLLGLIVVMAALVWGALYALKRNLEKNPDYTLLAAPQLSNCIYRGY